LQRQNPETELLNSLIVLGQIQGRIAVSIQFPLIISISFSIPSNPGSDPPPERITLPRHPWRLPTENDKSCRFFCQMCSWSTKAAFGKTLKTVTVNLDKTYRVCQFGPCASIARMFMTFPQTLHLLSGRYKIFPIDKWAFQTDDTNPRDALKPTMCSVYSGSKGSYSKNSPYARL
jgi:hypothetical protein